MAREICSAFDCKFTSNARGMCRTHYGKWLRANGGKATEAATRSYVAIDPEHYWQWVRKELQLG